jgi:hyperosmotically inducible protein
MTRYETERPVIATVQETPSLRSVQFRPRRRRWPGLLAAGVLGAVITAVAVSSWYDPRTVGQRLDAGIAATERGVQGQVEGLKAGAAEVAEKSAQATNGLAASMGDAGITAAVKAALAADPSLSALRIDVDTQDGVVTLKGPAPDEKSRERAGVLAAAPDGVRSVDNQLQLAGASNS